MSIYIRTRGVSKRERERKREREWAKIAIHQLIKQLQNVTFNKGNFEIFKPTGFWNYKVNLLLRNVSTVHKIKCRNLKINKVDKDVESGFGRGGLFNFCFHLFIAFSWHLRSN